MSIGAGKYDDACTVAFESTKAKGVVLVVFGGDKGNGFSAQAPLELQMQLPDMLEAMAKQIRADMQGVKASNDQNKS